MKAELVQHPSASEPFVRAEDVAEFLGISAATVYRWSEQRRIPSYRLNGAVRFRLSEILEWAVESRREARC